MDAVPDRARLTTGKGQRVAGAAFALLVQGLFVILALLPSSHPRKARIEPKEIIFLLPPLRPPEAQTIDARGPRSTRPANAGAPVVPIAPAAPSPVPNPIAPPSGLAGFGQSLFGCAPERYADLSPEERAHCPRPGEGLAKNNDDLTNPPRSRAKLEAMWQEQWDEDHWVPTACLPDPAGVAKCLLRQAQTENRRGVAARIKIADDQAKAIQTPGPKLPLARIGRQKN